MPAYLPNTKLPLIEALIYIGALIFLAYPRPGTVFADSAATSVKIVANPGGEEGEEPPISKASISFSGYAYPDSAITVLKDGQTAHTVRSAADASFEVELRGLNPGSYHFSLLCEDHKGRKSSSFSFSINLAAGTATEVGDIFMSPTIELGKEVVIQGEKLAASGQSYPRATVILAIDAQESPRAANQAAENGSYSYEIDTASLDPGMHSVSSKAVMDAKTSLNSREISFRIVKNTGGGGGSSGGGSASGGAEDTGGKKKMLGDFNGDGHINLIDFSILAYWIDRPAPPSELDLNGDEQIDLIDFSILAYYWTG
jgi:hypothetical protein